MPPPGGDLLTGLLKAVSRSFYRTLRILPGPVRKQIGLAYLLARATDTVADTELVPVPQRREALRQLRERILGRRSGPVRLPAFEEAQASAAERHLLSRCEEACALLNEFSPPDVERIRRVLEVIVSGQEADLVRFQGASAERVVALESEAELEDYTYRVAGCVGEFWTKMCRAHLFPGDRLDDRRLLAEGVRFGKGLQLVNILRDLPADLRQGRCYLPGPALRELGLSPGDLLEPGSETRVRPLYDHWLQRAHEHLLAGWSYTDRLPRRQVRVRLACAWPILIGFKTLHLLRQGRVLDPAIRLKVPRSEVKALIWKSAVAYPFPGVWRRLFASAAGVPHPAAT